MPQRDAERKKSRSITGDLLLFLGLLLGSLALSGWLKRRRYGSGPITYYRPSYFNLRTLGWLGVSLLAGTLLLGLVALVLIGVFEAFVKPPTGDLPPDLELEDGLVVQLQSLQATEAALLSSYGWIDREAGIAHIPIEQALERVAEGGLPTFPAAEIPGTPVPEPTNAAQGEVAARGAQLFEQLGCSGCHTETSTSVVPTLHGLFGEEVMLASGETVVADEEYLRTSILSHQAQVVRGYSPTTMPSFAGQLSEDQLAALLAYIRSLSE